MYRQVNMTKIIHFTTPQLEQLSSTASLFSYVSTKACVWAVLIRNAAIDGKVMLGGDFNLSAHLLMTR